MNPYFFNNSMALRFNSVFRVLFFFIIGVSSGYTQSFRAAVVKVDITPDDSQVLLGYNPRNSTGIHDRIYHRIVLLDDGNTSIYIVSSDICEFSPTEYDLMAATLKNQLRINRDQFWWAVTHTHSAPEVGPPGLASAFLGDRYEHQYDTAYTNFVYRRLIDGIREVQTRLVPARLGVGWGYSQANINRRARDIDDKTFLGLNPDGPVDRRIGILKITGRVDDRLIALIANYPIHGTVMGGESTLISGDAPGVVADYVEEKTGAPLVFINGAAGNLAPIYSVYPNPRAGRLLQFRAMLGDKIIEAQNSIVSNIDQVSLKLGGVVLETPLKQGLEWPADLSNYVQADNDKDQKIMLPIQFLRINHNIAIWSAPLELFCEISNEVRAKSPFPYTFYYGYTNGWLGYLPTEDEYKYGGYEPSVSPYIPSADKSLKQTVLGYLNGELKGM
jgi:hypothetical protein